MTCRRCHRVRLMAADFHRTSAGRLRGTCKRCKREYDARRRQGVAAKDPDYRPSELPWYTLGLPSRMFDVQPWRAL